MTYDKQKALQILEQMLEGETNENVITAIQDQQYGLSLGLVAYSQQLHIWSAVENEEHASQDSKEYWQTLQSIQQTISQAGIFSTEVLTD